MRAAVPVLIQFKVPISIVNEKYFTLMTSSILMTAMGSLFTYIFAKWKGKNNLNPKGNTGNPLVDMFNGVEMNPTHLKMDWKLNTLRCSMLMLAMLNVLLVADNIVSTGGKVAPQLILAAAFQIMFAADALFFEEYFCMSHDAMNTGFGWSLISSYMTFPFLPTLITRSLLDRSPVVAWYYLLLIGLMNAIGYLIFRSSETTKCEFAKDPANPSLAHLDTITAGNKKLIVSGWWNTVRHPNYLGEVLIQWSWVLPAVGSLGFTDLIPYYLPVVSTVMLISRSQQINQRNKRKYGTAWSTYCERVRSNILPKVY
jgi:hypothetical protein